MSEEKNLTDEEIVKALECCATENCENKPCLDCPYFIKHIDCVPRRHEKDLLDLIHRLQDENKRLTEEANQDTVTHIDICTENLSLRKQNAELQRQVDELTRKNKNLKYSLDTASGYIKKLAESCETNCKKFNGITTHQAVKDTAKEILGELDLFFKGTTFRQGYEFKKIMEKLKEMAKNYDVGVDYEN